MTELRAYRRALMVLGIAAAFVLCMWSVLVLTWIPAQEFLHAHYRGLLWSCLLPGLIASISFLVIHRPSRWLDPAALNSSGWVIVVALWFVRSVVALSIQHNSLMWRGPGNALNSLGFLLAIDLLVIFRVLSFLQFRIAYRRRRREIDRELNREQQVQAPPDEPEARAG